MFVGVGAEPRVPLWDFKHLFANCEVCRRIQLQHTLREQGMKINSTLLVGEIGGNYTQQTAGVLEIKENLANRANRFNTIVIHAGLTQNLGYGYGNGNMGMETFTMWSVLETFKARLDRAPST